MQKKSEPGNNIFVTWQFWASVGLGIVVVVLIIAGFTQGNLFQGMLVNHLATGTMSNQNVTNPYAQAVQSQTSGGTGSNAGMTSANGNPSINYGQYNPYPSTSDLNKKIYDLQGQVDTLTGQISTVQQNDTNLSGEINNLTSRVAALETQHNSLSALLAQGKIYLCSCNGIAPGAHTKCCNVNDPADCFNSVSYCATQEEGTGTITSRTCSCNGISSGPAKCCNPNNPSDCDYSLWAYCENGVIIKSS